MFELILYLVIHFDSYSEECRTDHLVIFARYKIILRNLNIGASGTQKCHTALNRVLSVDTVTEFILVLRMHFSCNAALD